MKYCTYTYLSLHIDYVCKDRCSWYAHILAERGRLPAGIRQSQTSTFWPSSWRVSNLNVWYMCVWNRCIMNDVRIMYNNCVCGTVHEWMYHRCVITSHAEGILGSPRGRRRGAAPLPPTHPPPAGLGSSRPPLKHSDPPPFFASSPLPAPVEI